MINNEPEIEVALLQNYPQASLNLNGRFRFPNGRIITGRISAHVADGEIAICDDVGEEIFRQNQIILQGDVDATFTVFDVKIGIGFHWQRNQEQTFRGNIILRLASESSFDLINKIVLEDYLTSVISSEMSATAPVEFLKAQAIVARSWLVAMLERKGKQSAETSVNQDYSKIIIWHDTNDHHNFDVCADDHCQRYQGIPSLESAKTAEAIKETRGVFLIYDNEICDARYYKCCGGRSEVFATAWEDKSFPYLQSIVDSAQSYAPLDSEEDVTKWLKTSPPAYCNTHDREILSKILPSFDQETPDFYRWQVRYKRNDLENIIREKSGIDCGELHNIIVLQRGPSGRISHLKIEGSKRNMIIGKELEIRRWLSPSHLLSSAFIISSERSTTGEIERFILDGGGWGHGVGLCQIGAAVMATQGFKMPDILAHYFTGTHLRKLY